MSRKAKMVLDKEFQIAPIDKEFTVLLSNTLEERYTKEFTSQDIRLQTRMDSAKM